MIIILLTCNRNRPVNDWQVDSRNATGGPAYKPVTPARPALIKNPDPVTASPETRDYIIESKSRKIYNISIIVSRFWYFEYHF